MKTEVIVRTKVAEVIGQNWVEWTDEDGNIIEDEKEIAKIADAWGVSIDFITKLQAEITYMVDEIAFALDTDLTDIWERLDRMEKQSG